MLLGAPNLRTSAQAETLGRSGPLRHSQLRGWRLASDPNFEEVVLAVALWGVQEELDVVLALNPVSVQPVSLERASPQFQYAEQVERVEL